MSTDTPQKINIGFHGGQVLSARVRADELTKLRTALDGGRWHELAAETGMIVLDLSRIDYVLIDDEQHKVGF